jgi:ribonuclease HII
MIGIDEVGRGALAGPLVVCGLRLNKRVKGLKDSKKLSTANRRLLARRLDKTTTYLLVSCSAEDIDRNGLSECMRRACAIIMIMLGGEHEEIVIDGNVNYAIACPTSRALVKADSTIPAVMAASIVAKVWRDAYMSELSPHYAVYDFHKHVGYGTKKHLAALDVYGPCDLHRKTFAPIRCRLENKPSGTHMESPPIPVFTPTIMSCKRKDFF